MLTLHTRGNKATVSIAPETIEQIQETSDDKGGAIVRCKGGARYTVAQSVEEVTKLCADAKGTKVAAGAKPEGGKKKK